MRCVPFPISPSTEKSSRWPMFLRRWACARAMSSLFICLASRRSFSRCWPAPRLVRCIRCSPRPSRTSLWCAIRRPRFRWTRLVTTGTTSCASCRSLKASARPSRWSQKTHCSFCTPLGPPASRRPSFIPMVATRLAPTSPSSSASTLRKRTAGGVLLIRAGLRTLLPRLRPAAQRCHRLHA